MSDPNAAMESEGDANKMDNSGTQRHRWCRLPKCSGELASTDKLWLCDNCRRKCADGLKTILGACSAVVAGVVVLKTTAKSRSEEDEDGDSSDDDTDDEE